jgi:hypothetical protein
MARRAATMNAVIALCPPTLSRFTTASPVISDQPRGPWRAQSGTSTYYLKPLRAVSAEPIRVVPVICSSPSGRLRLRFGIPFRAAPNREGGIQLRRQKGMSRKVDLRKTARHFAPRASQEEIHPAGAVAKINDFGNACAAVVSAVAHEVARAGRSHFPDWDLCDNARSFDESIGFRDGRGCPVGG